MHLAALNCFACSKDRVAFSVQTPQQVEQLAQLEIVAQILKLGLRNSFVRIRRSTSLAARRKRFKHRLIKEGSQEC